MVNVQTVVSTKAWIVESSQILSWKPCCLNSLYVEIVIYNWFILIIFLFLCVMFLTDCVYLCVHTLLSFDFIFWWGVCMSSLAPTEPDLSKSPGHPSLGLVPSRHLCRPRTLWIGAPWPGPLCVGALRPPDAWRGNHLRWSRNLTKNLDYYIDITKVWFSRGCLDLGGRCLIWGHFHFCWYIIVNFLLVHCSRALG